MFVEFHLGQQFFIFYFKQVIDVLQFLDPVFGLNFE